MYLCAEWNGGPKWPAVLLLSHDLIHRQPVSIADKLAGGVSRLHVGQFAVDPQTGKWSVVRFTKVGYIRQENVRSEVTPIKDGNNQYDRCKGGAN